MTYITDMADTTGKQPLLSAAAARAVIAARDSSELLACCVNELVNLTCRTTVPIPEAIRNDIAVIGEVTEITFAALGTIQRAGLRVRDNSAKIA